MDNDLFEHFDNLKNSTYRELYSASKSSLFWPKFYYSWFYTNEKSFYNILNLRQKLGQKLDDSELKEYNKLRVISL